MRKSFFAITPFCLALLLASDSSIMAEAALIYQEVDPELDFQAQTSGIFGKSKSKKKKETKKEETKKEEGGGEEKKEEEKTEEGADGGEKEESKIKNPFVTL